VNLLLTEYKLNNLLTLKNRIVMAPMTRAHATSEFVPTDEMIDYYARRSACGLIVTEGTIISKDARGHENIPGIFNQAQINKWRLITDKVHSNNGLIFLQIWHVGRVSHPKFLNNNLPIGPSATLMSGKIKREKDLYYGQSQEASLFEINNIINNFAIAAQNAIKAGFDGVEIHGANGYLIDQFLHYHTNHRLDVYGEVPHNLARFAIEVVKACGDTIGFDKVGIRLSPGGYLNEIVGDPKDQLVFKYLLEQLNNYKLAYVHTGSFDDHKTYQELDNLTMSDFIRKFYKGAVIACGSYTLIEAQNGIENNKFDLIAFGRPFIANYDLVEKIKLNKKLIDYNESMLNAIY